MKKILVTGGVRFIGSYIVRLFVNRCPDYKIINLEDLTYAGNLENTRDIQKKPNYHFAKVNILDVKAVEDLFD
jgi:dTDP-glucose 4,6-dehydratase